MWKATRFMLGLRGEAETTAPRWPSQARFSPTHPDGAIELEWGARSMRLLPQTVVNAPACSPGLPRSTRVSAERIPRLTMQGKLFRPFGPLPLFRLVYPAPEGRRLGVHLTPIWPARAFRARVDGSSDRLDVRP